MTTRTLKTSRTGLTTAAQDQATKQAVGARTGRRGTASTTQAKKNA